MTREQARALLLHRVRHYILRQDERFLCYAIERALPCFQNDPDPELDTPAAQVAMSSAAYYLKCEVRTALDGCSTLEEFLMRRTGVVVSKSEHDRTLLNEIRLDWVEKMKDGALNVLEIRRWLRERCEQDVSKFWIAKAV